MSLGEKKNEGAQHSGADFPSIFYTYLHICYRERQPEGKKRTLDLKLSSNSQYLWAEMHFFQQFAKALKLVFTALNPPTSFSPRPRFIPVKDENLCQTVPGQISGLHWYIWWHQVRRILGPPSSPVPSLLLFSFVSARAPDFFSRKQKKKKKRRSAVV